MREVFQAVITRNGENLTPEPVLLACREAVNGLAVKIAEVNLTPGKRLTPGRAIELLDAAGIAIEVKILPLYGTSAEAHEAGAVEQAQAAFTLSGV